MLARRRRPGLPLRFLLVFGTLLLAPEAADRPSPSADTVAWVDTVAGYVIEGVAVDEFAGDLDMLIGWYAPAFMPDPSLYEFVAPRSRASLCGLGPCGGRRRTPSTSPIAFVRELLQSPDTTGVKLAAVLMAVMSPDLLAKDAASLLSLLFLRTSSEAAQYAVLYQRILARLPDAAYRQTRLGDVIELHLDQIVLSAPDDTDRFDDLAEIRRRLMTSTDPDALRPVLRAGARVIAAPRDWAVRFYDGLVHVFQDGELLAPAALGLPNEYLDAFLALFVWRLYDFDPDHVLTMIVTQTLTIPNGISSSRWAPVQKIVDVVQHGLWNRRQRPLLTIPTLVESAPTLVASGLLKASIAHLLLPSMNVGQRSFGVVGEVVYHLLGRPDARTLTRCCPRPVVRGMLFVGWAFWDNPALRLRETSTSPTQMNDHQLKTSTALVLGFLRSLDDDPELAERHQILFSLLLLSWSEPVWDCRQVLLALVAHDLFNASTSWDELFAGLRVVLAGGTCSSAHQIVTRQRPWVTAFLDLVERRVSPHDNDMLHCFQSVLHDRRSGDDGDALDEIWRAASTVIAELDQSGGVSEDNTGRQEPAVVDQARSEQSFSFNSESQATQIAYSWNSHNDDDAGCAVDVTSAPTLAPVVARFDDRLMDPGRIPGEGPYTDLDVIPHWVARRGSLDASSGDPVAATVFGVGPLPSRQRRTAKPRHSGY